MKVLFIVHGYPPELAGGTERLVRDLAEGLVRAGDEVVVCAGTLHGGPGAVEAWEEHGVDGAEHPIRVLRLPRTDLYYEHWQKSAAPAIHKRVRELCRAERPDVVSLHHWTRLSRDLVLAAAREGIPATVHLHDYWTSCPLSFRVRPQDGSSCEKSCSGMACPPCAGSLPPFTPWVQQEALFIGLAQRQADLARELQLARVVTAPSRAHAEASLAFLGAALPKDSIAELRVLPPPRPFQIQQVESCPAPVADVARYSAEQPLVLAQWGGLSRLKGTDVLFESVAGLADPKAVRLILAGHQEQAGFVDGLRAQFPQVVCELHGPYERDELARHDVASAHAAVFPTRARESYGLVVDESLCLGLPCALSDVAAFRERFDDGTGVRFVESGSASGLCTLIESWIAAPAELAKLRSGVGEACAAFPSVSDSFAAFRDVLKCAQMAGAPDSSALPPDDWFSDRMRNFELGEWDRALANCTASELGFE